MIEQRDLEGLQGVLDAPRRVDVLPRGFGAAAGVTLHRDDRAGPELQSAHADLPGIDRGVVNGAALGAAAPGAADEHGARIEAGAGQWSREITILGMSDRLCKPLGGHDRFPASAR